MRLGRPSASQGTGETPGLRRELFVAWVHLAVLWAFGVAQPLFAVLADEPAFFVARDNTRADIVLLTVGLTLVVPTAMVAVEALLARVPRVRRAIHLVFVALLFAVIALQLLHGQGERLVLVLAALAGGLGALAYAVTRVVPSALTVLGPAPLVFALLFLFVSPVSELVLPQAEPEAVALSKSARTPVVLVVWDELSATSLLGAGGGIDAERFPNFAGLARRSTWYRNATTVADSTTAAVPAIFTGERPAQGVLPTLSDHPLNLFTLLGSGYSFEVYESASRLCPERLCVRHERAPSSDRLWSLAEDLSVVSLHQLVPEGLGRDLPAVDRSFGDFRREAQGRDGDGSGPVRRENGQGRGRRFEDFTRRMTAAASGRSLGVMHAQLPHNPLQYLPSGQEYPVSGGDLPGLWGDSWLRPALARQALQRHLLQQAYADRLLGALVRRLRRQHVWDRAMVVVTADHGINFGPSPARRHADRLNFAQVANVPLFVKLPGQRSGRVEESAALTIDILPTIAAQLGIPMPKDVDGHPLAEKRSPQQLRVASSNGGEVTMPFARFRAERDAAAGWIREETGAGVHGRNMFDMPAAGDDLTGRPARDLDVVAAGGERAELDAPGLFAEVDPASPVVPSYVAGRLSGRVSVGQPLAIAINGTLHAFTRSYTWGGDTRFSAMLAPSAFRRGSNRVEIFALHGSGPNYQLANLSRDAVVRLDRRAGQDRLVMPGGRELPVRTGGVKGRVERITYNGNQLTVSGWAVDPRRRRPADRVLLFADDRLIATTVPLVPRPDVAKALGGEAERSGFVVTTLTDRAGELATGSRLRILAVGDEQASRLELTDDAEVGHAGR